MSKIIHTAQMYGECYYTPIPEDHSLMAVITVPRSGTMFDYRVTYICYRCN